LYASINAFTFAIAPAESAETEKFVLPVSDTCTEIPSKPASERSNVLDILWNPVPTNTPSRETEYLYALPETVAAGSNVKMPLLNADSPIPNDFSKSPVSSLNTRGLPPSFATNINLPSTRLYEAETPASAALILETTDERVSDPLQLT
jgi:hypothetical protein